MNRARTPPVEEREIHSVSIEDIGDEGDGIARIDGYVVFVPQTQVGDEVRIVITQVGDRSGHGRRLELPSDTSLPFFAYGIFKQDDLGFHRIREYVATNDGNADVRDAAVEGNLIVEDGMALLIPADHTNEDDRKVEGSLVYFTDTSALMGYSTIAASEPMTHYSWIQVQTLDGTVANALIMNPDHDIENIEGKWFHPMEDPIRWHSKDYFEDILPVIKEVLEHNHQLRDKSEFFRLQMGYLLLWSAVERYISLTWGASHREHTKAKRERFAQQDNGFQQGLDEMFDGDLPEAYRPLARSDDPANTMSLDRSDPAAVINYLYQVRSNVTHRGKGELTADEELLYQSFRDLYHLFRTVLEHRYTDGSISLPPIDLA